MLFYNSLITLLASAMLVSAAPRPTPSDINWFPKDCNMYSCGWCHWYYDKDVILTRENKTITPDGAPAEKCLDEKANRWIEPCTFCKNQPYCQGDCIPKAP